MLPSNLSVERGTLTKLVKVRASAFRTSLGVVEEESVAMACTRAKTKIQKMLFASSGQMSKMRIDLKKGRRGEFGSGRSGRRCHWSHRQSLQKGPPMNSVVEVVAGA